MSARGRRRGRDRPVDEAMLARRPDKAAIRALWLERVRAHAVLAPDLRDAIYLTLPGAAAADIRLLIEADLLRLTETGAVHEDFAHRVVGIEANKDIYSQIARAFPGLKLLRGTVEQHLSGNTLTRFPVGELEQLLRARVVNLDLNEPWMASQIREEWVIPIERWVKKLGELHARAPKHAWTLLLTLHGECRWTGRLATLMREAFMETVGRLDDGAERLGHWLRGETYARIAAANFEDFPDLPREAQQRLLLWIVPAMLTLACIQQGWEITVRNALSYGTPPSAPMVTWVIDFAPHHGRLVHGVAQSRSLESILVAGGHVNASGRIVND